MLNEKTEYVVRAFSAPGIKPEYADIVFGADDLKKAKTNAKNQKKDPKVSSTAVYKRVGKKMTPVREQTKLREWLEEQRSTSPEQRNWKSISNKMEAATNRLIEIDKGNMLTKKGENDKELRKLIGNLKTLRERIKSEAMLTYTRK